MFAYCEITIYVLSLYEPEPSTQAKLFLDPSVAAVLNLLSMMSTYFTLRAFAFVIWAVYRSTRFFMEKVCPDQEPDTDSPLPPPTPSPRVSSLIPSFSSLTI